MNSIKLLTLLAVSFLAACSSGGGGGNTPPVTASLDGVYRGSPPIVSANGLTYDHDDPTPGDWQNHGNSGRVYTTTVQGTAIDGTASIYRNNEVQTQNLTGDISPTGAMTLNFVDGPQNVQVNAQRLAEPSVELLGRAWCTYEFDTVTVKACSEFDVTNSITLFHPGFGRGGTLTQDQVHVTLGEQVDANAYEASFEWEVCGSARGVVGIAVSEDGTTYELVVNMVNGACGYVWLYATTVR